MVQGTMPGAGLGLRLAKPNPNPSQQWETARALPGEGDGTRNNARCTQARKATHGLDGQHQDVDRTLSGRVSQNEWRKCVHGVDRGRLKTEEKRREESCGMSRCSICPGCGSSWRRPRHCCRRTDGPG